MGGLQGLEEPGSRIIRRKSEEEEEEEGEGEEEE